MEYEDLIEEEAEPLAALPEDEDELEVFEPENKSPWKTYVLTGVLAGLIGGIGGGIGVYAGLKAFASKPVVQAPVDLSPLETEINQLTARVKSAEAKVKTLANKSTATISADVQKTLETRLQKLETAPKAEISAETLTALQSAQDDGFEWPDVSGLQAQITSLEEKLETPVDAPLAPQLLERLSDVEANITVLQKSTQSAKAAQDKVSALENRLTALEKRPAPKPVVKRVSILAFPKAQLIEAVDENRTGGLIEKTLSRHIRVKEANDPLTIIEAIETDLSDGRLAPAIEKFERLPAPVQSAGQAWYDSVKASL